MQSAHFLFIFFITKKMLNLGKILFSKLNLVDLAGSERAKKTKAVGERFKEGKAYFNDYSLIK